MSFCEAYKFDRGVLSCSALCLPTIDLNWTIYIAQLERRTTFMKQILIDLRHDPDWFQSRSIQNMNEGNGHSGSFLVIS